jgi:hypothetical protein
MGRWTLIILLSLAGCTSENPVPGEPCDAAETCGPAGDAACIDGYCHIYDGNTGYGGAIVNLSFNRDMYEAAACTYIHFLLDRMADGSTLTCQRILSQEVDPASPEANSLVMNPKYLILHWASGGTFFPDNLIQFIRPSGSLVAVAQGYEYINGEGDLTALGCNDEETILKDQNVEFVIQLNAP